MKIGIVGGGISGLYCANLLSDRGNDVTIYENNKWGGVIQYVDGYPVSILYLHPLDFRLKKYFKKNNIKLVEKPWYMKNTYNIKNTINIFLASVLYFAMVLKNYLLVIITILIMLIYIKKPCVNLMKSFGTIKYDQDISYLDSICCVALLYFNAIKIPENGFSFLINDLLSNPNISYIKKDISNITDKIIDGDEYDEIILACDYDSYKNILPLSKFERYHLSNITNFDFYTTLKHTDKLIISEKVIGFTQLDDDVYLLSSHEPLNDTSYKWKMGYFNHSKDIIEKFNGKKYHYIGNSMCSNGVYSCMNYVEQHVNKYFS